VFVCVKEGTGCSSNSIYQCSMMIMVMSYTLLHFILCQGDSCVFYSYFTITIKVNLHLKSKHASISLC